MLAFHQPVQWAPAKVRVGMRIFVIMVLSGTLGLLGCSSSDGDGGSGGSAGTGGDAGGGGVGGLGGAGGEGGAGGTVSSTQFCDDFEATCSYGDGTFFNRDACLSSYEAWPTSRQECVVMHLGFAEAAAPGDERDAHCRHAAGQPPCGG